MTYIKICGLRTAENALAVARAGADMLGLNFYPKSPRYLAPEAASEIVRRLREALGDGCPAMVGVFVNESADDTRDIVEQVGLDFAQLSGDESIATLRALGGIAFKAIRPADVAAARAEVGRFTKGVTPNSKAPSILLDAFNPKLYGGTGETAGESIALAVKTETPRLMLAGGLNPENVAERVRRVSPWGVDVASGVEAGTPGIKDEGKARAFIEAVRAADA
ncbi:MAG: phosphoribosylanthranilate isomerase [Chloroflexota bacterium]|nr:phosphoribosylanthranilate isomerase [Chloroflexota bacterium]MDE2907762.1 phosphoribosylanthranilate isomerase [Chloroflexota bacterium]